MACGDVLSLEDLQTAKKHQIFEAEVITGKAGGVAGGAAIDTATNPVTGQTQQTLPSILADLGFDVQSWTSSTGGVLASANQVFLNDTPGSLGLGDYYAWGGTFPKTVPAGTDPALVGSGYIMRSSRLAGVQAREALRRSYAEAGYNLVDGSFEAGGTLVNTNDVLLQERTGKAFSGPAGTVAAGTNPASGGFVDSSSVLATSLSVVSFGAAGSPSDETAALQRALNAAEGKTLHLEAGKTYRYTTLDVKANTTLITNGAVLSRITASTSHGITINAGVTADTLRIVTPGGAGGDKAVKIQGSNVSIGILSITAAAQGVYNSFNLAVDIISNPAGTVLSNISIGYFYCKYFTSAIFINNVTHMTVNKSLVEYYRTAYYLQDVANSEFSNVVCQLTSAASYGTNGENGLLIGSTLGSGTSHDLTFNNWSVANSGEHAYRLGGDYTIRNVWFNGCRSRLSGSSIVVNNPAATFWTGGCGFKVLGGTKTDNERHENIFLNGCVVQDIEQSFGPFPGGHGVINFTPYMIISANNVHLVDCIIEKILTPYSCRYGLVTAACDGLTISNPTFRDCSGTVIKPLEDDVTEGYPFEQEPVTGLTITGGLLEIISTSDGIPFYFSDLATQHHRDWNMTGTLIKGGKSAVRIEAPSTGSLTNISLDFTYVGSNVDDSTYNAPVVVGAATALLDVKAPWRPLASSPSARDGSIWQDTLGGKIYQKTNGAWKAGITSYKVTVADDAFVTVVPPSDFGAGFFVITGTGLNRHMMAWFRATAAPSSAKYFGSATVVIVATPLNGTTGTDGNITVGVQDNLIYIENRSGGRDTFAITFL